MSDIHVEHEMALRIAVDGGRLPAANYLISVGADIQKPKKRIIGSIVRSQSEAVADFFINEGYIAEGIVQHAENAEKGYTQLVEQLKTRVASGSEGKVLRAAVKVGRKTAINRI